MSSSPPLYSVDASALIEMKDVYPYDVLLFRPMWDSLGSLADAGRLVVAEPVSRECQDPVFRLWFNAHGEIILAFSPELNDYVNALHCALEKAGLPMVNPTSPKSQNDPFVVASALLLERRVLTDLRTGSERTCHVISYEKNRGPTARYKSIKDVCDYYSIRCLNWPEMLRLESSSS
jgi:hypothetical protein